MANPLQQAAVRRKVYYLAAVLGLFTLSILWRGKVSVPLSDETRSAHLNKLRRLTADERRVVEGRLASGDIVEGYEAPPAAPNAVASAADWLRSRTVEDQASPDALDLRELDQGDPEVAATALRLSLTGSRGMAVAILWKLAIDQQKRNEFHEFEQLVRAVTRLQPNFITPWIYQSWNIAYNVSVENDRLNDMYFYISRGIELLAEGERLNKKSPDMRYQIAFYYQNKFGVSDKVRTLRSLMQLSCIRPEDRDPKRGFRNAQTGEIDAARFQEFCRKNPQLVRRLKEQINYRRPEEIVQFLEDNIKVPSRYDPATGQLAKAGEQFPLLPPAFKEAPDEYHPKIEVFDDSFDAFHAARAWYEYALTVVPPPSAEPEGIRPLTGEERFKYRIPKSPAMILFRQGAPRAQTYLAERLSKEGWFEPDTKWDPDERADTEEERWFPRGDAAGGLKAGTSAFAEWRKSYERWKRHGEQNGLYLEPARLAQLQQDALGVGSDPNLYARSDDQLAKAGLTRKKVKAADTLRMYDMNRQMTNFPYFLSTSEAEADRDTIAAREQLMRAEKMVAVSKPEAIRLYADALATWRAALVKYPFFHHPDGPNRADRTEEETYEHMYALITLLERSEQVESRARSRIDALRVLGPVDEGRIVPLLAQSLAEDEAGYLISAADPRVRRRAGELSNPLAAVVSGAASAGADSVTRAVVASDFPWLAEYKSATRGEDGRWKTSDADLWVASDVRQLVRQRAAELNPGQSRPAPPNPTPAPVSGGP